MDVSDVAAQIRGLKEVAYVDKVYNGVAEMRRRMAEPPSDTIDLRTAEHRIFSQNGEDGVVVELVRNFGSPTYFVEFGVGDGWSCNTRVLAEVLGWEGTYFEIDPNYHELLSERYANTTRVNCVNSAVTPASINELFRQAGVPSNFGVLSIDIDGQDFWVWEALSDSFRPDIVVVEVNLAYGLEESVTESLDVQQSTLTTTWGASLAAMTKLAGRKRYRLVHVEMAGLNAFFVRDELVSARTIEGIVDRSANYGLRGRMHSLDRVYGDAPQIPRPTTAV